MSRAEKVVVLALGGLGLLGLGGAAASVRPPVVGQSLGGLVTLLLFAFLALGIAWPAGNGGTPRGVGRRLGLGPGRLPVATVALLVAGTLALSQALELAIELCGLGGRGTLAAFERALSGVRGPQLALALAGLGLAPPLGEELFFRGLVQRGLERRLADRRAGAALAVAGASALFGLAHLDPVHSAGAFVLGLYLGAAAWLAGSIRASIACHVANNLAAVLGSAFAWSPVAASPAAVAAGLALAGAALLAGFRVRLRVMGGHHVAGQHVPDAQEHAQERRPQE